MLFFLFGFFLVMFALRTGCLKVALFGALAVWATLHYGGLVASALGGLLLLWVLVALTRHFMGPAPRPALAWGASGAVAPSMLLLATGPEGDGSVYPDDTSGPPLGMTACGWDDLTS